MKGKIGAIALGVLIVLGIIVSLLITKRIPAGYVGVVYSPSTGVAEQTLKQGWHMVAPWNNVTEYSIGIEQSYLTASEQGDSVNDESFSAPSKDGKGLQMELTFTYKFQEEKVSEIFTRFKGRSGEELLTKFIKPNIISWTKEVTAKYQVADILGDKRAELNGVLSKYLAEKFEPYGIIVESASLINIDVDKETKAAVTKKVTAQQELELSRIKQETEKVQAEKDKAVAIINAEKDKETARIEAEKDKIKAEGEAKATRIKAKAEADANKQISKSLTKELINKIKYENWDGKLPQVSGSKGTIINLSE